MAEVTYYYDYGGSINWTGATNAFDNDLGTFATTSTNGGYLRGVSTTCDGADLGTITKVEIRAYAYGDGNDRLDLSFALTPTTPEYQTTPASSAAWGIYVDVTSDPNIDGWTWVKVQEWTDYLIFEFVKVGKTNTMYCAKVEIRVTYTEGDGAQWKQLQYTSEPPTANAWNQLKHTTEGGWNQIDYEGE